MWVKDGWRLPHEEARVIGVRTGCSCEGMDVDMNMDMDVDVDMDMDAYWLVSWAELGRQRIH